MNNDEELRLSILEFAERFGKEWLPKLQSVSRSIQETMIALDLEGKELSMIPGSYSLQCAREQYINVSQLCGELWETLTNWENAIVPLFPDVDCEAELPKNKLEEREGFSVSEKEGVVLIQMPFPIKRYAKKKTSAPALGNLKEKLLRFSDLNKHTFSIAGDNIFYFWYVYPLPEKGQRWYYPDNDNYLIKPIIDTICEALAIQDKGTDTFLFSATALSSEIPEGAYALLVPQADMEHDFRRQTDALRFIKKVRGA